MDNYLYKRKSDGKVFHIKRSYEVFVGITNWYEGPQYEKEYVLTSFNEEEDGEKEEVITRDLLSDYDKLTNC